MGGKIIVKISELLEAKVLVVGAGITGKSVARELTKFGATVTLTDEKRSVDSEESISIDEAIQGKWDLAVVSPGWRIDHPFIAKLRAREIEIISEVDLAWELRNEICPSQKWIGITGTNGKTTTVELTAAMLKAGDLKVTACGNLGDTVIEAVCGGLSFDWLVVELSSFQLEWSQKPKFHSVAILNIADDHVDWHKDFKNYVSAKLKILDQAEQAILNADDGELVLATQSWKGKKTYFTLDSPRPGELGLVENLLIDRSFVADSQEASVIAELVEVSPSAPHSVSNTLAAAGLARSAGISHQDIRGAIKSFSPGSHRIETVLEADGILWINDSKATNPHAAQASLMSQLSVVWIAGGLAKGANMSELISKTKNRIKVAILIGTDRELIAKEIMEQAPEIKIIRVDDTQSDSLMERVVKIAKVEAQSGDSVLLAPACASMDQFISYADRGDQFSKAVQELVAQK